MVFSIQPMDWRQQVEMLFKDLPREALMRPLSRSEVVGMLVRLTIFGAATYYSIKWVVDAMDPTSKQKNQAKKRVKPHQWACVVKPCAIKVDVFCSSAFSVSDVFKKWRESLERNCTRFISLGRTADEEDWSWGGQTNRVWNEHCISLSWSTDYEGNSCDVHSITLWLLECRPFYFF